MSEPRREIPVDGVLENIRRLVGDEAGRGTEDRSPRPDLPLLHLTRKTKRPSPDSTGPEAGSDAADPVSEHGNMAPDVDSPRVSDARGAGWTDSGASGTESPRTPDAFDLDWADSGVPDAESLGMADVPGAGWTDSGTSETESPKMPYARDGDSGAAGAESPWPPPPANPGDAGLGEPEAAAAARISENESPRPGAPAEAEGVPDGFAEPPDGARLPRPRLILTDEMRAPGFAANDDPSESIGILGAESSLDEETLRVLVSEMVREELSGGIGERVVRELVRWEIHRVLASRDFK